jgi:hypothetical protein
MRTLIGLLVLAGCGCGTGHPNRGSRCITRFGDGGCSNTVVCSGSDGVPACPTGSQSINTDGSEFHCPVNPGAGCD